MDPLASDFAAWTPYHYVFNNPLIFTDPDGKAPDWIYDQQADGSYKRREGVVNDGGENFHTYVNNDGTTMYHNVQAGSFTTVNNAEVAKSLEEYRNTSDGERLGRGLQKIGDGVALVGYGAAPFTEGASLSIAVVGEGISGVGTVVENVAKFSDEGATSENIIDAAVDIGFEILPAQVEKAIEKTNLDKSTKNMLKAEVGKVTKATEHAVDQIKEKKRKTQN